MDRRSGGSGCGLRARRLVPHDRPLRTGGTDRPALPVWWGPSAVVTAPARSATLSASTKRPPKATARPRPHSPRRPGRTSVFRQEGRRRVGLRRRQSGRGGIRCELVLHLVHRAPRDHHAILCELRADGLGAGSALAQARANGPYLLGLNEPDMAGQSNMTAEQALDLWPRLMAAGKVLGSPAVATGGDVAGG